MFIAVQFAALAKKALQVLVSDKKGRRFLGYVIGIAVFIVLLPLIILVGMFGWMSGGDSLVVQSSIADLQEQYSICFPEHAVAFEKISTIFDIYGVGNKTSLAQTIYINTELPSMNESDDFYTEYVHCFVDTSDEKTYIEHISEKFGVEFSEEDIKFLTSIDTS